MGNRTPIEVTRIVGNTTYTGEVRLYWLLVKGSTDLVVTCKDDTTNLMTIDVPDGTTRMFNFTPSVVFETSLAITFSGTGAVTVARSGGY